MATVQTPIAEGDRTPNRDVPPMPYPRRIRYAANLAWRTLRTGRYLDVEAFLKGSRMGMDTGARMAIDEFAKRGTGGA